MKLMVRLKMNKILTVGRENDHPIETLLFILVLEHFRISLSLSSFSRQAKGEDYQSIAK